MEGAVIDGMSDEELQEFVPKVSVYARVSPEHKIRIVKAWQDRGNLVAMTGDGINDVLDGITLKDITEGSLK